ncbi:dicarboxylate/amino acid:cation symporter [Algisphaera agarilytica]|uniref:Na+/H+-dicarboxylate symporter n=1 Tax=Algisphaera agarilytica TaxID=1385975 RepID=A0A7X0H687_9BACT|nr:dicarboxylate/amino acid:cation symporter [Algisphaera agarilytica]MBB6430058.1 Na+/H+-dicarboxylate symporter [Algisphaera agarilytica]
MNQANEPHPTSSAALPWRWPLHWQVLLGLVIGALVGLTIGSWAIDQLPTDTPAEQRGALAGKAATASIAYLVFDLIGDLFIQGLKLIIVPLVTSSIILAIVGIGRGAGLGRLGGKTLLYYGCTSLIAILIGLTLINFVSPGVSDGQGILVGQDLSAFEDAQEKVEDKTGGKSATDFLDVFRTMVPPNLVKAASDGSLLGLIVVSLFVGYFLARLDTDSQPVLVKFTQGVYDITLKITDVVLKLAPIGVMGLLAATVGEQYAKLRPDGRFEAFLTGILQFAGVALAALLLHLLVVMPLILMLVARVNPLRHYKAMAPALITAFSTASSSATLPLTMDCVEKRAGVSRKTTSFVLPLGATVNMDGTALYECVAAIFICQAFGIELSFAQQFMIVITALLTSIGVAGVPSASLVAIVVILTAVEKQLQPGLLPEGASLVAGMGLLFVFDRPLDMCRTAVNIFSDSVGAVVLAKTEGETDILRPA